MDAALTHPHADAQNASQFRGKRVHFIGVGGSGMSGLASMLLGSGAIVSGSEPNPNSQTFELARRGAKISRDQKGELLDRNVDLVVRTAAAPDSNLEVKVSRALQIKTIKYAQMLGLVMDERFGVAVAGTHGKSTTSAMIGVALLQCGMDPSVVIGGVVPQLGGSSRAGLGRTFVAEACEFDRSFHNLQPNVAVITNIEEDHLDCYKDLAEIIESFRVFAQRVPATGTIIAGGADANVMQAIDSAAARVQTVGIGSGFTWSVRELRKENGCCVGEVSREGKPIATLKLSVPGEHNLLNATMALAVCSACGADLSKAAAALGTFTGVDRRMTRVGTCNGAIVVDDYGHHPTEIRATLKALREKYQPRRLFCVFQPHQHSRTRFLLDDFASSFSLADETVVPDIYFVRDSESERQSVSSNDLVQRVRNNGQAAIHFPDFAKIVEYLRGKAVEGDLIVTMGAGNVWEIGRELVE